MVGVPALLALNLPLLLLLVVMSVVLVLRSSGLGRIGCVGHMQLLQLGVVMHSEGRAPRDRLASW